MKSIKFLLDPKKVKGLLKERSKKIFPDLKLVDCKIEPIKIYLDYKTVVAKYQLILVNEKGVICKKNIVGKAEEKGKGVFKDYSTIKLLRKQGMEDLLPEPLDYVRPINLYLYSFIPGYFLQKLSIEKKEKEFLEKIPEAIKALKKVHSAKIKKKSAEKKENEWKRDVGLIKKYWPSILNKVCLWKKGSLFFKEKNKRYFSSKPHKITHGDFYSRNILVTASGIKLIDFSNSAVYDPLNDIGNFFINTELMLEYDFPADYLKIMKKLDNIFTRHYFSGKKTKEEELKINYFAFKNLIRIIAFAAISEGSKQPRLKSSEVINKLLEFGEKKYKNLL